MARRFLLWLIFQKRDGFVQYGS